jgi:hypothetical protein
MVAQTFDWVSKQKNLWIVIFAYTILTGLFVQLILLPYMIPAWHSGDGLIKGVDGQQFHTIALRLSETIKTQGWATWEPTPKGQFVSGMAAIFYVLIYPQPWSVLPLNALLNASACVCLYLTLASLIEDRTKALIASLPFIFFPSNLLWNTQLHNENYAIPGVIFILYGWTLTAKRTGGSSKRMVTLVQALNVITLVLIGSILLGLVRIYILSGMSYLFIFIGTALGIYWLFEKMKMREYFFKLLLLLSVAAIMLFAGFSIKSKNSLLLNIFGLSNEKSLSGMDNYAGNINANSWNKTEWLPEVVNGQLKRLAKYRNSFVRDWADGGSSIDLDITFKNAGDMAAYIPRAIQISFLSPFPADWFSTGKKAAGTAMRLESAFEMMFVYFSLFGLPIFIWHFRKQPAVWVILFACTSMLIIYAMIIPNIGALYRFRYPYLMPLVCFGVAGWICLISRKSPALETV